MTPKERAWALTGACRQTETHAVACSECIEAAIQAAVEAEREACAAEADADQKACETTHAEFVKMKFTHCAEAERYRAKGARKIAEAIRARGAK